MMRRSVRCFVAIAITLMAGCSPKDGPSFKAECNPLGVHCMTPFPSDVYTVPDNTTATGLHIELPFGALPTNDAGTTIDGAPVNGRDGWSPSAQMLIAFPGGFDPSNLVPYTDYPASLTDASPTVVINLDTGERVAHFAEPDLWAKDPSEQALIIRPHQRLDEATRYAVGIRKSLKALDKTELPMPDGFRAILDGRRTSHAGLERVRGSYDEIFSAFEAEGIDRSDLVVAWSFTTGTTSNVLAQIELARDAALPAIGANGELLDYAVVTDEPHSEPGIRKTIQGTIRVPLLLTQGGAFDAKTKLLRDEDGNPTVDGYYDAPFTAMIPECAYTQGPVPIMNYGHGLFGTSEQVHSGALRDTAEALCMVIVGTDFRGMSTDDVLSALAALNDVNNAPAFFEVQVQGVINNIALGYLARGAMADEIFVDDSSVTLVDPSRYYYYGLSQGHIFGSTIMAYDPVLERGVLGVGGINYSIMLERSTNWPTFRAALAASYSSDLDMIHILGLMQMLWDITDPVTSAAHMGEIPGTPSKQILLHMAVGDAQVPNIATEYHARTMGAVVLQPSVREPFDLPTQAGPITATHALVIFDGGHSVPEGNVGLDDDNGAHSLTRKQPAAWRQMQHFYETGEVIVTCQDSNGAPQPCDCTKNYCD